MTQNHMQSFFKYSLTDSEQAAITEFCNSSDYCAIEQYPGWFPLFFNTRLCYYYLQEEQGLMAYCLIIESHGFATIEFGPVSRNANTTISAIRDIVRYYKSKRYLYLGIQLPHKAGYDTDYIEYQLNKLFKIQYRFDNRSTKSSLEIDLGQSMEEILRDFRKGHKSDIKKAQRLGMIVEEAASRDDLEAFAGIYQKMCAARKINEDEINDRNIFKISGFLSSQGKGYILIVKNADQRILGGIILVNQGNTLRYFKGASDPGHRDSPVLHIALYEAIKKAQLDGFRYFDFWGINHFAGEEDQAAAINRFKKGFGGYLTFFAKRMHIALVPFGFELFRMSITARNLLRK